MQMVKHRGGRHKNGQEHPEDRVNLRVDGKVRALYYGKAWKKFCSFRVKRIPPSSPYSVTVKTLSALTKLLFGLASPDSFREFRRMCLSESRGPCEERFHVSQFSTPES
jgi:hypothetical protein